MSILGNMSNLLFGVDTVSNDITNESPQMLAARMQSTSKLSLGDTDQSAIWNDRDPFNFKYFHYPQEVGHLGDGHYIQFDILENKKSKIKYSKPTNKLDLDLNTEGVDSQYGEMLDSVASKAWEGVSGGLSSWFENQVDSADKKFLKGASKQQAANKRAQMKNKPRDRFEDTHDTKASTSIILYTPPTTNKFGYKAAYDNAETGMLGGLMGSGTNLADGTFGENTGKIIQMAIQTAAEMFAPGVEAATNRKTGMAMNPNLEMAFKSVPFRDFTFAFDFAPKNTKELDQVHKIMQLFKFHMLPALTQGEGFFISPSQFVLTYMYRKDANNYIPKLAKCVLTGMDVDYSPGEKFTTLKPDEQGASPQHMKMSLSFTEMSIITKETIGSGY
jgi:hypothetical protein